ncbi:MAG: PqqD family protein [Candidatus Methylacidiphilales bacterium]|nr:PqqD family protein [Candidatus Methylacidiphilales bacterium]
MTSTLQNLRIDGRGIALDPVTGETFRLVGCATHLVRMLQDGATADTLLRHLLEGYDVDEATARRDLDTFLSRLEQLNWVEAAS